MTNEEKLKEELRLYVFHEKYMRTHMENIIRLSSKMNPPSDNTQQEEDNFIDPNQTQLQFTNDTPNE